MPLSVKTLYPCHHHVLTVTRVKGITDDYLNRVFMRSV
jgi:hypothetical protein